MKQERLQEDVENAAKDLFMYLDKHKSKLLMLHFLSGSFSHPYILRRSAICTSDSLLDDLVKNKELSENEINEKHRTALSNYIAHFNRSNTFLHLVINRLKENFEEFKDGLTCEIVVDNEAKGITYEEKHTANGFVYTFSKNFIDIINPRDSMTKFFNSLYIDDWSEFSKTQWKSLFDLCLYELFGQVIHKELEDRSLKEELEYRENKINEFSAYQSGILYFIKSLQKKNVNIQISSTIKVIPIVDKDNDDILRTMVAIITPAISNHEEMSQKLLEIGNRLVIKRGLDESLIAIHSILKRTARNIDIFTNDVIKNVFRYNTLTEHYQLFVQWIMLLAKKVSERLHEGKRLEFYFIIGDKSEFEDSIEDVIFKKLNEKDINPYLNIPSTRKENVIEKQLEKIADLLSKEHYPWFENGRNALFWDIQADVFSGERYPTGLISFGQENWRQILQKLHAGTNEIDLPNCLLYFVSDISNVVKIIKIKDKIAEEILRFQNNKWFAWNKDLYKKALFNIIRKDTTLYESQGVDGLNIIAEVVTKISKNSQKGGIILFTQDKEKKGRKKLGYLIDTPMGIPWDFESYSNGDLISLISHDGASILNLDNNKWQFRKLLSPNINKGILKKLYEYNFINIKTNMTKYEKQNYELGPLSFVGSRRWNGIIAAYHKDVYIVIVISQDGDIHIWKVNGEKNSFDAKDVEITMLYLNGEIKSYNMDDMKYITNHD